MATGSPESTICPTATSTAFSLLVGVLVVAATLVGRGPFGGLPPSSRVLLAQAFVAVAALVSLVLALHRPRLFPRTFGYHELWHTATSAAASCHLAAVFLIVTGST